MPKPFANSAQITYSLVNGDWLLGIQTGNSTGDAGLPQMKHIKLSQLSDWVRGTYGQIWRYRGEFSVSLPSDPQFNDYFLATATFTVDSVAYTKDHLYAYNASGTWDDISKILTQYASQVQVTDIDDRLTVVEVKVDAMGDGVVYKGEVATYADLAGIVDPQTGWEYFVTANASFYIYNGSSWDQIDNGIVQTITDGDTSHAPSGDAVYDALASEASARESADSNLLSAIDNNSQRIENLEVAVSGSLVQTNVLTDPPSMANVRTITNANEILPWAILKRVGARSIAWNQLMNPSMYSHGTDNGITSAVNNGKISLSGTSSATGTFMVVSSILDSPSYWARCARHKVLFVPRSAGYSGTKVTIVYQGFVTSGIGIQTQINDSTGGTIINVASTVASHATVQIYLRATEANVNVDGVTLEPQAFDLTVMLGSTLADYIYNLEQGTAGAGVAYFRNLFPSLYYPYNAGSIIPLNPSAFKVVGKNKFANAISIISGGGYYSSGDMYLPKGSYILTFNNVSTYSIKYWLNGSKVSDTGTKSLGAGASASFSFSMSESGIMSFGGRHDPADSNAQVSELTELMIRPSTTSATYEPYTETTIDTSFTEDYLYVNENCHDYSENVLVDGVLRRKDTDDAEQIDLGDLAWSIINSGVLYSDSTPSGIKIIADSSVVSDWLLCGKYENDSPTHVYNKTTNMTIAVQQNSGRIFIYDTSITSADIDGNGHVTKLENILLNYGLAQKVVTYGDPIPNFPCEDGTTVQAVTPQTDLVNAIDVPSTIAYMTKISS